ncbi:17593_t:CDS:1, partial [Entrophospora sp. SA101]
QNDDMSKAVAKVIIVVTVSSLLTDLHPNGLIIFLNQTKIKV